MKKLRILLLGLILLAFLVQPFAAFATETESSRTAESAAPDAETLRALSSLLLGVRYFSAGYPGDTASWTDEAVCDFIYGKLIWDDFGYSPDSALNKLGLTIRSGSDSMWHFDLELIDRLTRDALGREYPAGVWRENIHVSGDELLVSPAAGESTWIAVQNYVRHGDQIIAVGSMIYESGMGGNHEGYFQAVFDVNPSSIYGYTLVSLNSLGDGEVYTKLAASASSTLKEATATHWPGNVLDGDNATAWVEGVRGVGEGEWILLETADGSKIDVTALEFALGYHKSEDLLAKNGWPGRVRIECEGGYREEFDFYYFLDVAALERSVVTSWIKITIVEAQAGSKYEDTCISEIRVRGIDTEALLNSYVLNHPPVVTPTAPSEPDESSPEEPRPEESLPTLPLGIGGNSGNRNNRSNRNDRDGVSWIGIGAAAAAVIVLGGAVALIVIRGRRKRGRRR